MGTSDNWNAIDPNIVIDDAGTPWMDFGSFWGGVKMIKIDAATGGRATDDTMVYNIADRPQGGAAAPRGSLDFRALRLLLPVRVVGRLLRRRAPHYNIRVGRSTSVNKDFRRQGRPQAAGRRRRNAGSPRGTHTVQAPGINAAIV